MVTSVKVVFCSDGTIFKQLAEMGFEEKEERKKKKLENLLQPVLGVLPKWD